MTALVAPSKTCTRCGERKGLSDGFFVARMGQRGFPIYMGHCKTCDRARNQAWTEANREHRRAWEREWKRRKRREDPEWWATFMERKREEGRRRRGTHPSRRREHKRTSVDGRSPSVDAAPFAAWLSEKVAEYGSVRLAAEACKVPETWLSKVKNGQIPRVELASVDAALQAEGSTMLEELGY